MTFKESLGRFCLGLQRWLGCECWDPTPKKDVFLNIEKKRNCTDVPCLILFLGALIAQIIMLINAKNDGSDPEWLVRAKDYQGNLRDDQQPGTLVFRCVHCARVHFSLHEAGRI